MFAVRHFLRSPAPPPPPSCLDRSQSESHTQWRVMVATWKLAQIACSCEWLSMGLELSYCPSKQFLASLSNYDNRKELILIWELPTKLSLTFFNHQMMLAHRKAIPEGSQHPNQALLTDAAWCGYWSKSKLPATAIFVQFPFYQGNNSSLRMFQVPYPCFDPWTNQLIIQSQNLLATCNVLAAKQHTELRRPSQSCWPRLWPRTSLIDRLMSCTWHILAPCGWSVRVHTKYILVKFLRVGHTSNNEVYHFCYNDTMER